MAEESWSRQGCARMVVRTGAPPTKSRDGVRRKEKVVSLLVSKVQGEDTK